MRQALASARLRESLSLQRPASLRNATIAGAQVALAVILVAGLLHVSPWAQVAGFGGLGALAALFGRFAPLARRRGVVLRAGALLVMPVALLSLLAWSGLGPVAMLLALSGMAGLLASLAHRMQMGAPGAVIFIFAASAAISPVDSALALAGRAGATVLGVAAAWLLCLLTDRLRDLEVAPPAATPVQATAGARAPKPLTPGYAPVQSARVALCAALAALLAHAAGWAHPAWASIGAVAVLQGAHLPGTVHRGWQRTLGTVVGAGIAWAILSSEPSFWTLLLAVAVLQVLTEAVIGFNYALGQIFVTPMALLMTNMAHHGEAAEMALSRIFDTTLGAAVGIVLALVLSSLDERVYLARHHGRAQ
ncbi:hypothetical protein BA022_09645 [Diaphorobacter nitroreducens]|nr:hypothetical protein BA022_09645 [Diaphorobacter nitroreducens]